MGVLHLAPVTTGGIDPAFAKDGLSVRYRRGGEEIRLQGRNCTHKLKKLLQQDGIFPWMRDRLPLLYAGDKLVAVADLWIAAECIAQHGLEVRWGGRPPLR
jgi:tRNA(Ile)-lysidine synthase